ncbi:SAM-dependent methyltransferase [Noviherbaspirillum galbum]|uniref:Class I SAM-dependent methyltransferase n=1 Tax=Noviherbaspirillum galbum TaxID=2709383 RepID=A0A6B3SUX6_9BURK|nr:cyclopropane-fatty-acyl-phospholipid synthase family protein [Noviherbaspirillum galbum]NEX64298.1 class I SAM-dependent methyltransferase [Noviherbaspirillum galbum]
MNTDFTNSSPLDLPGMAASANPATKAATRTPYAWTAAASALRQLQGGSLRVQLPDGSCAMLGTGPQRATLAIRDWRMLGATLRAGDIGFAESFIAGHWDSDNLPGLLELLTRNRAALEKLIYGSWWGGLAYRLRHLLNRNSKAGSRKNIHAHYDIGNAFYRLWLDAGMTYSSALYAVGGETLEQAQSAKYRRVLDQLRLRPQDHVLEIGCGWGGFAEAAARETHARVTGLTLSTEQLAYARSRMEREGMAHQVGLMLQDYRDVDGRFDAIASIEMFEAVGEEYWNDYFACIARCLKAGGRACIQSIVIDDALFERYRRGSDFIQQYIFPGGMLPSPSAFKAHAGRHGLALVDSFAFGQDYATTLAHWRAAFNAQRKAVNALGLDQRFCRTWDFYLAYCEAGFRAGSIDVMHFTLEKA